MYHIIADIYLAADNGFARVGRTRVRRRGRHEWREFIRPQDFYTLAGAQREVIDMMSASSIREQELSEYMRNRQALAAEIAEAFERVPDELRMDIRMERLNQRKKEEQENDRRSKRAQAGLL